MALLGINWKKQKNLVYNRFPGSSAGKETICNAGDPSSIRGLERYAGGGHGNPLQYSFLENPMDRGFWQATVPGVRKNWT